MLSVPDRKFAQVKVWLEEEELRILSIKAAKEPVGCSWKRVGGWRRDGGVVVGSQGKACGFLSGKKKRVHTKEREATVQYELDKQWLTTRSWTSWRWTSWAFQKDKCCWDKQKKSEKNARLTGPRVSLRDQSCKIGMLSSIPNVKLTYWDTHV